MRRLLGASALTAEKHQRALAGQAIAIVQFAAEQVRIKATITTDARQAMVTGTALVDAHAIDLRMRNARIQATNAYVS